MTDIHAGYRIPASELDEIPMGDCDPRAPGIRPVQTSRPMGDSQRRLEVENYWSFTNRHRLAVIIGTLFIGIFIAFIGIAIYLAVTPDENYADVEIDKIMELEYPATVEPGANDLEEQIGIRIPVPSIPNEFSERMIDDLYKVAYDMLPNEHAARQKRQTEAEEAQSCRERHEDCKILLTKVKKTTKSVAQQIHKLQTMINKLGMTDEQIPSLQNTTVFDFATCLKCEKLERQNAGSKVKGVQELDSATTRETSQSQTQAPAYAKSISQESIEPEEINAPPGYEYFERIVNVTSLNDSVVVNPNGTKSLHVLKNVTVALIPVENAINDDAEPILFSITTEETVVSEESFDSTVAPSVDVKTVVSDDLRKVDEEQYFDFKSSEPKFQKTIPDEDPEIFGATTEPNMVFLTTMTLENETPSTPTSTSTELSHSPEGKANFDQIPFVMPTAESTKGSQQVTYTPSLNWMPYPLCVYGSPNAQPQTPAMPMQPFIQSGIPFVPSQVPVSPQRYGPTGPGIQYYPPNQGNQQQNTNGPNRPLYCMYVPTPTLQFPVIPGVSEFQRAVPPDEMSNKDGSPPNELDEKELKSRDYGAGCPLNTRLCNDRSACIPRSRWCDGRVDCGDASDEIRCSCRDRVGKERLCDGYFDCPLGEDELGCFGCDMHSFSCDDTENSQTWGNCLPLVQRCDGYPQCPNGKDELNCNIITHSVEEREMFSVGYTAGFLHRNWKGKWYPACTASKNWANDACRAEIGDDNYTDFPIVEVIYLQQNYDGPYVVELPSSELQIVNSCLNKAVYVNCPRIPCGTRISSSDQDNAPFDLPYYQRFPPRGYQVVNNYREANGTTTELEKHVGNPKSGGSSNGTNIEDSIVSSARVVGGHPSQPRAWPSLAVLNRDGKFHCGCVILDEYWILTAAHCIDGYQKHYYDVQAGILRRFSYSPMEQSRKVSRVVMYPAYDRNVMRHDIALLRLETPLYFNRWVRSACLPEATTAGPHWRNGPPSETICISAGWGSTVERGPDPDHLREVELPILPNCKYPADRNEDEICAGEPRGGRDTCQGDSGGPLMCRNPNSPSQWYVAGIVSHGEGCARPNEPGAYTKVSRFVEWIDRVRRERESPENAPLARCPGYYCHSSPWKCYPAKKRCDKIADCMDAEDELNCQRFSGNSLFRKADSIDEESTAVTTESQTTETEISENETKTTTEDTASTFTVPMEPSSTPETSDEIHSTTIISTTVLSEEKIEYDKTTEQPDDKDSATTPATKEISTRVFSPPRHFSCEDLIQTIDLSKRCDRIVDCQDGTDEVNCTCKDYLSKVNPSSICDGHIDCADNTDEDNCDICAANEFHCQRSRECVTMDKRCDRIPDCLFNEDELNCLTLTNGKYVITDLDGIPHHNTEGILSSYEGGKWMPFCIDGREDKPATLGKQMCSYFGFGACESFNETRVQNASLEVLSSTVSDVIPYEYSTLFSLTTDDEPHCTALYLRCLPTIHTVPLTFRIKSTDGDEEDDFLWPWNAAVFVDGRYACSGVLLEPSWVLTSSYCVDDVDLKNNYTAALLGASRSYLHVDGPHQQMSTVDEIKTVKNSDAVLLHLKYPANMTRQVQPMYLQKRTHPPVESDTCVTVGVDNEGKTRTLFLKAVIRNCPDNHRCYRNVKPQNCRNETRTPWSGTIVCYGCSGWYPAAVYHVENGLCSFAKKQSFSSIDYMNANLITGMQETVQSTVLPICNGFRCPLGKCVEWKNVCNGVPDCRDGADEEAGYCQRLKDHCANGVHDTPGCHCARSEMRCGNGQCVSKSAFCDGEIDCVDGTDEPTNCTCAAYLELVNPEWICDGRRHCLDKSDESPDSCLCKDASFKCGQSINDGCVPRDFVCDGQPDCSSGEDEKHCLSLKFLPSNSPGYGEVIQRSFGVWHSRCFAADEKMPDDRYWDNFCKEYGYQRASNVTENDVSGPTNAAVVPALDKFYMVRPNRRIWVVMRDDKSLVSLHSPSEKCLRRYVTCT
ncbi:serine protease nudel [Athalia rosae]|uniref:serine protease nudel n=1 Tax=Athalia rosae TaxID=37344 RepID=UPI002033A866|nr:serine protease nudel [Athalia rosae]